MGSILAVSRLLGSRLLGERKCADVRVEINLTARPLVSALPDP